MDFIKQISDYIHFYIRDNFPDGTILFFQILSKLLLLALVVFVVDFVVRKLVEWVLKYISTRYNYTWMKSMIDTKIHVSFVHFVPWVFADFFIQEIFWRHPKSYYLLELIITIFATWVLVTLVNKILKSIERYYILKDNQYRVTMFRAIYGMLKLFAYICISLIVIAKLMGVTVTVILGYVGGFTALILLIFRDTILGLITGLHVSISKNLKVGDWVGIKKYDIEGNIQEINLLTTKIKNFDKTVSTIPTYDLLSTEIKNIQIMYEGDGRRIKRSIYFNIKSFRFIDDAFYDKLKDINLISDYLENRYNEIKKEREQIPNGQRVINGKQLTNIGVFRIYTLNYLKNNPNISQHDMLLVRQMEISPEGMPLEIYCFANKTGMADYEQIQADIFDHILTAAAEFDLEVMQMTLK